MGTASRAFMSHTLTGGHGDPPRTRRHDYGLVVLQLFWRMRLDLLLFAVVVAGVTLRGPLASRWTLTPMGLSVLGIAVSIIIASHNTPIPALYHVIVRLITWLYGIQLVLEFQVSSNRLIGTLLCLGFLTAERIGAYVEGPFDCDGSSFSLPLNAICSTITGDLMPRDLDFGGFQPSSDPARWD